MHTMPNPTVPFSPPASTSAHPPPPVPPPDVVRVRVDLPGVDYRALRRIAVETECSTNEMTVEGVRMLVRWYQAQGIPAAGGPGGAR
jgi:hypothetical protein